MVVRRRISRAEKGGGERHPVAIGKGRRRPRWQRGSRRWVRFGKGIRNEIRRRVGIWGREGNLLGGGGEWEGGKMEGRRWGWHWRKQKRGGGRCTLDILSRVTPLFFFGSCGGFCFLVVLVVVRRARPRRLGPVGGIPPHPGVSPRLAPLLLRTTVRTTTTATGGGGGGVGGGTAVVPVPLSASSFVRIGLTAGTAMTVATTGVARQKRRALYAMACPTATGCRVGGTTRRG